MTIFIAGLGPGSADLLTLETRRLLAESTRVILRTRHHPAVGELDPANTWSDCDDLYAGSAEFETVYEAITARVLDAAALGDVTFAVPGNPLVAERSVALILERCRERSIPFRLYPALSFVDVAATALGADLGDVQLCDALGLRIDPERPALISQVFDRDTATNLKLALLDAYPPDHVITLIRAAGAPAQSIRSLPLSELDHGAFSYLDTIFVPSLPSLENLRRFDGLWGVIRRLHAPDGCPWDLAQDHFTLRKYLIEETYEVIDAIDSGDLDRLTEELGDLLLQVLMHAGVAERTGEFTLGDITEGLARKMIHRHPHVFATGDAKTPEDVRQNWEKLKQAEKPLASILEGVPSSLPALSASQSLNSRARRAGFDWPDIEGPLDKLVEEMREFVAAGDDAAAREDEFGDILFVIANIGDRLGIDAEQALRGANTKFRRRFTIVERLAAESGTPLDQLDLAGLDDLWNRAKSEIASRGTTRGG